MSVLSQILYKKRDGGCLSLFLFAIIFFCAVYKFTGWNVLELFEPAPEP